MHASPHHNPTPGAHLAGKECAMPLNGLSGMTAPATRPEPAPGKNHINTAILSSVREAASVFGTASQARNTLKDMVRLLIDFNHFRMLCVADLKSAFQEQRQALNANFLAREQGQEAKPNRIVRNRKGCWETLFRYFAKHARIDADVEISAGGHQGDYTCELKEKKKRESELEKAKRVFEEHGISRRVMDVLYVRARKSAQGEGAHGMAAQPEESPDHNMADSPDQQQATVNEPVATPSTGAQQTPVLPDAIPSLAGDVQQTSRAMPESVPTATPDTQDNMQAMHEKKQAPPRSWTASIHPITHRHGAIPVTGTTTIPKAGNTANEEVENATVDRILQAMYAAAAECERVTGECRKDYPRKFQELIESEIREECLWEGKQFEVDEEQLEAPFVAAYREKAALEDVPVTVKDSDC